MPAIVMAWGILVARTFVIQVIWADRLASRAQNQIKRQVTIPAARGEMYDRQGRPVAINWHNTSAYAYPNETTIPEMLRLLPSIIGCSRSELRQKLYNSKGSYTWLVRQADDNLAAQLTSANIPGVLTLPEMTRAYPYGRVGAQCLGFVDTDNRGLAGVEYACEHWLSGKDGLAVLNRDGWGRQYRYDPICVSEPQAGRNLTLTLDIDWQMVVEEELSAGILEHGAQGGMAVIMDCQSGEILAMADEYLADRDERTQFVKSRVVSDVFEPGSSFKLVPFAAVFSEGPLCPVDSFDAEQGRARFSNRFIRDDKKFDWLTLTDAFRVSSNIVTGRMANVIGGERLRLWALRFGFGSRTGVLLPAEQKGSVPKHRWSEYMTAAFSIGHGVSVTTLQLATAYATLANGGLLVRPYVVKSVVAADGKVVYSRSPQVIRRVLSPDVAAMLLQMSCDVVTEGTAQEAFNADYRMAGKTGTAEKPDHATKTMVKNKYIASFVGFWPADNPRLVGAVVLDEPEPIHYGGWTAAPMLLNMFKRGSCSETHRGVTRPVAQQCSPMVKARGNTEAVSSPAMTSVQQTGASFWSRCQLAASAKAGERCLRMPDVTGCVARAAVARLTRAGLTVSVQGTGQVVRQDPQPGTDLELVQTCELVLQ